MRPAFYIHDWATWLDWAAAGASVGSAGLFTESPLVYEKLTAAGYPVEGIVDFIPESDLEGMFKLADRTVGIWVGVLDQYFESLLPDVRVGYCLRPSLVQLLHNLLYKARTLTALLERSDVLTVPYQDAGPNNDLFSAGITSLVLTQGTNHLAVAAQARPFDGRVVLRPLAPRPPARPGPRPGGRNFRDRALDIVLRFTAEPFLLATDRWLRLATGLEARLALVHRPTAPPVLYLRHNPLACAAALIFLGRRRPVRFIDLWIDGPARAKVGLEESDLWGRLLSEDIRRGASRFGVEFGVRAAAVRLTRHLAGGLLSQFLGLQDRIPGLIRQTEAGPGSILLTGDFSDPLRRALARRLGRSGVTTAVFPHGCKWRSRFQLAQNHHGFIWPPAAYVYFSEHDQQVHRRRIGPEPPPDRVQGSRLMTKATWPGVARYIARRRWRLSSGQRVLVCALANFARDNTYLVHNVRDLAYWQWIRRVINDVVAPTGITTVIKTYSKGVSRPAESEVGVAFHVPWPKNVRVESEPALPWSRFAADVLLVDRAEATLDWALDSDIPLIFLNHRFAPVDPSNGTRMAEAIFFVDTLQPGGEGKFRDLLNLPPELFWASWVAKRSAREDLKRGWASADQRSRRGLVDFLERAAVSQTVVGRPRAGIPLPGRRTSTPPVR